MEHFAAPTTRAEAQAYIEHEFKKGGVLLPEDLYQPTNVYHARASQSGTSFSFFFSLFFIFYCY